MISEQPEHLESSDTSEVKLGGGLESATPANTEETLKNERLSQIAAHIEKGTKGPYDVPFISGC